MAITKTNFINYTRCPRYFALNEIKTGKLEADISYKEYLEEEKESKITEMLHKMYEDSEGEEIDLIDVENRQLKALMPYYKRVEEIAGEYIDKHFGGKTIYAENTKSQECFDFSLNGLRYICYVDIYNENNDSINIIEVKATTSKKYADLTYGKRGKDKYPLFSKRQNIYKLNQCIDDEKSYQEKITKLKDRYTDEGKYIYDLSVQRYIIENEFKQSNNTSKLNNIHYYLAVLNHEYIFDGYYENGKAIYRKDENGEELITLIDLTEVTTLMLPIIEQDAKKLEKYIFNSSIEECPLGKCCEFKKQTKCKYFDAICGSKIPKKNSSLNYMDNPFGFLTPTNDRLQGLELINSGYLDMLDIPEDWITKKNHQIQRNALKTNTTYIDKTKIEIGLNQLQYPIYHLDFETFPCPIPRFKGEKAYTQSPFEFSLHIEHNPGECDKEKDNIVFLAKTHEDEREELIQTMLKHIDPNKGTLFAQNISFEKTRIKELAECFPEYKKQLLKIIENTYDLIWLVKTKTEIYKELGYSEEEAKKVNYYHKDLSGSYSIKKTLPVFSDLSYKDLVVKNGTDAIVEYANYPYMTKEEYQLKYDALVDYCKQDTWAMVVILNKLYQIVEKDFVK